MSGAMARLSFNLPSAAATAPRLGMVPQPSTAMSGSTACTSPISPSAQAPTIFFARAPCHPVRLQRRI